MLTTDNTNHPITFRGKSTDTRPIDRWGDIELRNGDAILEMDTGEVYFYDGDTRTWNPPA